MLLILGVFVGPSAYRMYERYKRRKHGQEAVEKPGPSYLRRLLGMLTPVFVLIVFLILLTVGLYYLGGRPTLPLPVATPSP